MSSISARFFATAALFGLIGMGWGVQMSVSQDHSLSPAHGHLNLIGFVAMAVFGTYYALSPRAAASRLATIHYWLSIVTVVVLTPGIALAISGETEIFAKVGSILAIAAMAMFGFMVIRNGVDAEPRVEPSKAAIGGQPAE